jgi:alkylhydroperoxidase family enzyme
MATRYDALIDRLRDAAQPNRPVPAKAAAYAATVRRHAYKVTDGQVEALLAAGLTQDEIFELTVAAAVGAGLERLDAGLQTLR